MSSADTVLLPFLVRFSWFQENHVCAVVVSVLSGILAHSIWRFALQRSCCIDELIQRTVSHR